MSEPTFVNLGFESAGSSPGAALAWQLSLESSAEDIAGFRPTPESPMERFESGWLFNEDFAFALGPTTVEPTLYDSAQSSIEDFEEEWFANETFLFEHSGLAPAYFDIETSTKSVEDFDELWFDNGSFAYAFSSGSLSAPFADTLEAGWRSNQSFLYSLSSGNVSAASYDVAGTAELVEDFDELWPTVRMVTL